MNVVDCSFLNKFASSKQTVYFLVNLRNQQHKGGRI